MTIKRSFDLDKLIDATSPYPEINPPDYDFEGWLANQDNIMLVEGKNVGLLSWEYDGVYTGHYFFNSKGKNHLDLARRMVLEAIINHGARLFRGLTPTYNRKALIFNRKLGMKSHGVLETNTGPHELFTMTAEEFLERNL